VGQSHTRSGDRPEATSTARYGRSDGTEQGSTTSTEVTLSGLSVAGQTVDPGCGAVQALIDAARAAYATGCSSQPVGSSRSAHRTASLMAKQRGRL